MLCVTVEFLHGTVRAGGMDDTALTGHSEEAEWPPSPARLFQAFVAADGTRDRRRVTSDDAHLTVLGNSQPTIYASGPGDTATTPLQPRFVVLDESGGGGVQNYPARKAQEIRPGARLSLKDHRVAFVWNDESPDAAEFGALALRAARISYLGCSDSPVRVRVIQESPEWIQELATWSPDPNGTDFLPTPGLEFLEQLDTAFDDWFAGNPRRRSWLPTPIARYRSPLQLPEAGPSPATIWLRFDQPIGGRRVRVIAETLRAAVLEHYERLVPGGRDAIPSVIHGHHEPGERQYEHARWLPLPNVGHQHSDGRIRGACIWLPAGTPDEVVEYTRLASAQITRLVRPRMFDVAVEPFDGTTRPRSNTPPRWSDPARRWITATPAVVERFTRRDPDLAEIARWCQHAHLPEPVEARFVKTPIIDGGVDLAPTEAMRNGEKSRPYGHVSLRFAEPVSGPVAIGRGRHFGLGLCAPIPDRSHR